MFSRSSATTRVAVLILSLGLLLSLLPADHGTAYARQQPLSASDVQTIHAAGTIAVHSPARALAWVLQRHNGTGAALGRDGTLLITLPSGRLVAVLRPGAMRRTLLRTPPTTSRAPLAFFRGNTVTAADHALVLEPFANELGLGPTAGTAEADTLAAAGFSVDVKRNADVTVPVMETLGSYAFVYMETHSGVLPNGDAIVVTGDTHTGAYSALAPVSNGGDGSLMEATVAGDQSRSLYIAVTAAFVNQHVAQFHAGSVVFLNGCSLIRAPVFWQALQNKGVGAMISWDQEADVNVTEPAAHVVVHALAADSSVVDSIAAAYTAGLGVSPAVAPAHLGLLGDGSITLGTAPRPPTATAIASPTAFPSSTAAPTATSTPAPAFHFTLVSVRFEKNTAKGNATRRRLKSVRSGSAVRLTAYYSAGGSTANCRYTDTFTLKLGTRRVHTWTQYPTCHAGVGHDSIFGVKLARPGTYTLQARAVLGSGAMYSAQTKLTVK